MEDDFIYWAHPTPVGIKVEEISGMQSKHGKLWLDMALQIFCEHGPDAFREIGHFRNGAPFIFSLPARISITHTKNFLAVAMLPKTPEADLSVFNPRTALGIDAEALDRSQVLSVREKYLSEKEKELVPSENLVSSVIAWTCKEALYKASMTEGINFKDDLEIIELPQIDRNINKPGEKILLGKGIIRIPTENLSESFEMNLYSYESDGNCVTLAFSPKCAKFGGHRQA